ncbi:Cys-Gln thioester bond-forming surface protein [Carbonactinospora thermoautotrophica]|uniref:Cys-Gln thioester bond-forming surface protein n=1 Tax=Carbonactinospora thermoautotrophica TaxID=1469144 RepID=UPI00226F7021|nr:Cys-Gln thioester bond-forming surface protein [Carbonactinospora thermoautotrophica]
MSHTRERLGVVLAGLAGALLTGLGAATPVYGAEEAVAAYAGTDSGQEVRLADGERVWAGLHRLDLSGTTARAYSAEPDGPARPGVPYGETDETGLGDHARRIGWIVRNSVPNVSTQQVARLIGKPDVDPRDATAAAQAAIWHFSDDVDLDTTSGANREDVVRLYQAFTDSRVNVGAGPAGPALEVTPRQLSGAAGLLIGAWDVFTSADRVDVTLRGAPEGTQLLDEEHQPVPGNQARAENGAYFFVRVPADAPAGEATLVAEGVAPLSVGQVFTATDPARPGQALVLAESVTGRMRSQAKVRWTAATAQPSAYVYLDCPRHQLRVFLRNRGAAPARMTVNGQPYLVAGLKEQLVRLPSPQAGRYRVEVAGPGGYARTFTDAVTCVTDTPSPLSRITTPAPHPAPTPSAMPVAALRHQSGGLARTGADTLPWLVGGGVALLVGGAVVAFLTRRRG